jgi:Holliday junction resolvase RusA-like endonuclease
MMKKTRAMLRFEILGIPKPKQSARFRIAKGKSGNQFIASYQKKEVKENEANIGFTVIEQLPQGFIPFDCPVSVCIEYVFPMPASFSNKKVEEVKGGKVIYKETKPDLTDNLNKGLIDALAGIVYVNDSRICSLYAVKFYGLVPRTVISFCDASDGDAVQLYMRAKEGQ